MILQIVTLVCSCIFLTAESSIIARHRRFVFCDELKECTKPFDAYGDPSHSSVLVQLTDTATYEAYCRSLQGMDTCVQRHIDACWSSDEVTEAEFAVEMAEFMCRDDTRTSMQAVAALPSTCLDNSAAASRIDSEQLDCVTVFEREAMALVPYIQMGIKSTSEICPLATEMGKCAMNVVKEECDSTVIDLFDKMVTYVVNVNAGGYFGCAAKGSHLRRSLALLKKR